MEENMLTELQDMISRKIAATFIAAFFPALFFAFWYIYGDIETSYNQGNDFIGWFLVYPALTGSKTPTSRG